MDQKIEYAYYGSLIMVSLLAIQFLLGIYINLYVAFPPVFSNSFGMGFRTGFGMGIGMMPYFSIVMHITLAFLILFASFIMLFLSLRINNKNLIIESFVSFFFVLIAGLSGFLFLFNENNIYSFMMAVSFVLVFLLQFMYVFELSKIKS